MRNRERRVVLLGALVIALSLVLRAVPASVSAYRSIQREAVQQTETIARARAVAASQGALRDSFGQAARELVALAPKVLSGTTPAEAAADLSGTVSREATRNRLRVIAVNAMPDSGKELFRPVTARARLEGDMAGLAGFLRAIESADQVLSIQRLSVQATDIRGPEPRAEVLRIEVDILGWRIARGEP